MHESLPFSGQENKQTLENWRGKQKLKTEMRHCSWNLCHRWKNECIITNAIQRLNYDWILWPQDNNKSSELLAGSELLCLCVNMGCISSDQHDHVKVITLSFHQNCPVNWRGKQFIIISCIWFAPPIFPKRWKERSYLVNFFHRYESCLFLAAHPKRVHEGKTLTLI